MKLARQIKIKIEPIYNIVVDLCILWFFFFPIKKRKIVFIQGCGGGYRCNLKYVTEEIINQHLSFDIVWLVNNISEPMPKDVRKVKYNRIKAVYELATSSIVITNSKSLIKLKKKSSQKLIYIPHGQPGAKCAEGDAILPKNYLENSKKHSAMTDIFISMGTYHTQVLKDTFWVPKFAEIWEIGFPRNDQYYHNTIQKQKVLRKRLNISEGTHIVLYAPTFRDSNTTEAYNLDFHKTLNTLKERTNTKWIMFITFHPNFIWFKKPPYVFDEFVWNMSDYPDLHELLLIVDVTITDYSSVALDFANLRRPVFLYASDVEEYKKMRGLKDMYFKLPFTLCRTNDELCKAISDFDEEAYQNRLVEFQKDYGSVDDGHAAERFVSRLKDIV